MAHQQIGIHRDIAELISTEEATEVTPLMCHIYYRLLLAPPEWWESKEALRVRGSAQGEVSTMATDELVNWLRVSPKDMHKAFQWLNKKNVINYFIHPSGREIEISFENIYVPE